MLKDDNIAITFINQERKKIDLAAQEGNGVLVDRPQEPEDFTNEKTSVLLIRKIDMLLEKIPHQSADTTTSEPYEDDTATLLSKEEAFHHESLRNLAEPKILLGKLDDFSRSSQK